MYKLGTLETNGQNQDATQCNNRDVFTGHNVNNSSCNLSSPPSEPAPKSSTTSVLRRWRRPESYDSKNVQSKELPTPQPSSDKQMNPGGTFPSGESTTSGDFSLYVPQLSPLVPQSTARPYDSKYVPQYADKDKTQNYYPENTNQEVHFRSPTYPGQNTPPLAHTSSQKYAYPNREFSVVAHNYSPQKINPLENKVSAQEDYGLSKYENRISPQNMTQTYPIQNSVDRRVSPHNPKSPIYRNYPQNVQQNFAPTTKGELQNNYYLDKSPCSQKQVLDARYQNYNQNYVKTQDPKYRSNSKKSSPPFPILEQRLNQETSYCAEYPGTAYYPQKYGPVMFSRSPTPKIVRDGSSAYPNIHHNPKIPPQEVMLPQTYPFTNKYYPQNQSQDWKMLPKEYEQNLYLSQMNQMHARLPHPKTDLPRDLSYVDQNQRLVQKSRMYSDCSPVEHLQYPGKSVPQKSPKIAYNTENDYLNLSRSCAAKPEFQRSKLDYSPVIQSVKSAEIGYDPKLSREYLMQQCSEQQNYVCSPPLMGQNRNHPAYPVGYPRQPKINEIPPRNISPRRTFQENMPVVVYSPQHIGIPKTSPTQMYPSEYSNPQYYPGYYPRDAYPGVKPGMPQYPVDQSRKYPVFNGNMPQQRFHFGYPEQYYQHKIPEAEKLNYFQGNVYRGHYNPNIQELQQNVARNFEDYRNVASNYSDFETNRSDDRTVYGKKDSDIGKSLKEFLESWEDDEEIVANLPDLVLCNNIPPEKKLPFSEETSETSKSSLDEEIPKETEQPLYILGSTNISSDALPQYLAVYEQVDRLPDNIKGFYKGPSANATEETQPVNGNIEKPVLEVPTEATRASLSPHDLTVNKNKEEKVNVEEEVLNLSTNRNKENNEFLVEEYSNHSENSIQETTESKTEEKNKQISENTRKKIEMIKQVLEEIKKNESSDTEEKCIHIIPIRTTKKKDEVKDEAKKEESEDETKLKSKILATTSVIVPNTFFDTNKTDSDILNNDTKKDEIPTLTDISVSNISEIEMNNNEDVFQQLESSKICDESSIKPKENIENLNLDVIDFETTDLIPRKFEEKPEKRIDNIIEPMSFENLINSPENIEMKDDDSIADEFEKLANHETIIANKICSSNSDAVLPENECTVVENIEDIVNNKTIVENIEEIVKSSETSDTDIPANLIEVEQECEKDEPKLIENISESVIPEEHIELLIKTEEIEKEIATEKLVSETTNDIEKEIETEKFVSETTNDIETNIEQQLEIETPISENSIDSEINISQTKTDEISITPENKSVEQDEEIKNPLIEEIEPPTVKENEQQEEIKNSSVEEIDPSTIKENEQDEENKKSLVEEIDPPTIKENEQENNENNKENVLETEKKEEICTFPLSPISNYILKDDSLEIESSPIVYSNEIEDIDTEETNMETPENYTEEIVEKVELVLKEAREEVIEEMEQVSEEINDLEVFQSEEIIQSEVYFESTVDKLVITNVETIQDDSNDSEIQEEVENIEDTNKKIEEIDVQSTDVKSSEENQEYAHLVGIEDQEDKLLTKENSNEVEESSDVKNTKNEDNNNFDFSYLESCTDNICEKPKTTSDVTENNLELSDNTETCNSLKSILDSSESESDIPKENSETSNTFDKEVDIQPETELKTEEIITFDTIETESELNLEDNEHEEEIITEETVESENIVVESENIVVESENIVVESENIVVGSENIVVESENVTEINPEISNDGETVINLPPDTEKTETISENVVQIEEKQFEPNLEPENKDCEKFDTKPDVKICCKTSEKDIEAEISNILTKNSNENSEKQLESSDACVENSETEILIDSQENEPVIIETVDKSPKNISATSENTEENNPIDSIDANITESVLITEDIPSEENIILPENSECVVIYEEDEQYVIIQNEENSVDSQAEIITQEPEMIISEISEPVNEEILVEAIDPLSEEIIICEEGIEDWVQNEEIVTSDGEIEVEKVNVQTEEKGKDKEKQIDELEKDVKHKNKDIKSEGKVENNKKSRKRLSCEDRKLLLSKRKKVLKAKKHDKDIKKIIEKFINEEKKYSNPEIETNVEKENSVEEKELFMNPENPVSLSDNPYPFPVSTSVIKRRVSYEECSSPKIDFKAPKRRYSSMETGRCAKKPIINLDEISKNITEVLENLTKQEKQYVTEKTEQTVENVDKVQEIKKDVPDKIEEVSNIHANNFDISPKEKEEIVESKSETSSLTNIETTENVTKLVEQLIKPKLIIPKTNFDFTVNNLSESKLSPEPLLVTPKRRPSLLKTPDINEDSSPIINTARLTEPIFPKNVIPESTKRPNVDPRIDRPKEEKEEKPFIENKLSNTFSLTEYTKNYIKMKTGQTVDLKNIGGMNGHKRIDPRLSKEDGKVEHKKKDGKSEKKVKINLQDYRNRKQSQSSDKSDSSLPQINGLSKESKEKSEEPRNKNKAERKLYQIHSKQNIPDRKVEKLIIKPKKSLEPSKDILLPEVNSSEEIKSNPTNKLDCNNLDKSKDFQQAKPKKRKKRFRNLYTMDEEDDVPTKQPKNSLEPNGLHNEDSTCSKMSEDSQSTANSSRNEDNDISNGDSCCLDLNSNGTSETNCAYKCHIKINSKDKSIRDYEINKNSCSNSNRLKLTLKPVQKKKPAFSEVLSNLDSLAESEIRLKRPKKKVENSSVSGRNSDGTWTTKKVPKVIIKRKGNGYCAVYRDVSSNPIWQPKIRLKRQRYIESLVLRGNS